MLPAAAPIAAGGYVAGLGLNAIGQHQALSAMRDAWGADLARQKQYDAQLNQQTQDLLARINPQTFLGQGREGQLADRSDSAVAGAVAAAKSASARRPGNAEGKAVAAQAGGGSIAELIRSGRLQAMLQSLRGAGQNVDMLGRQYGIDTGVTRGDARDWASLAPMHEAAAATHGQEWRQLGQMFQQAGELGMMGAMSAPGGGAAAAPGATPGYVGPSGGPDAFASSSQYAASGQGPTFLSYFQ